MDFKGVTRVGNAYEKFEAMCLELEKVMYEDTVKYMEGQMQKVSGSVKKFCSEIIQDLLPPLGDDHEKIAACDLFLGSYGHLDVVKKPTSIKLCCDVPCKKKSVEDMLDFAVDMKDPLVSVENKQADVCATKSEKSRACRLPIGIKRISKSVASENIAHEKDDSDCIAVASSPGTASIQEHILRPVESADTISCSSKEEKVEQDGTNSIIWIDTHTFEPVVHHEDNFDMEVIEKAEVSEPEMVVESQNAPNKKKILEALGSKLRQKKKKKKLRNGPDNSLESDWELV